MTNHDPNRIIIFDTTLRDGEQALPQSLSARQKMQIALALEQLGVDVIETGFPVSSPGDFESVRGIASVLKTAIPCGLSRAVAKDIDACYEALRAAERYRIHTFIPTSEIHVKDKLRKDFDQILAMGVEAVRRARNYTDDVEFSCEDAGRTPIDTVFIGSCTNGRLEDFREAAKVLVGRHVADGVRALAVPGSMAVRAAAEAEGLDRSLRTRL